MPSGQLDREEALYTFFLKRSNFTKGTWGFLKCYKPGQLSEPSWIWKTMENMIMWALKKSKKMSFIVQRQARRAYQQLQTQKLHKQSGRGRATHTANANIKLDTAAHKPARLRLLITLAIILLRVTGDVNLVDMGQVIVFRVGRLVALWLFIVRSDNVILAIN